MNWWQRLSRRRQMEEQLNNEVQFHIEQHAADLMARGMDPENARRQARLAIGGPEQVKESCRDARGTRWLEELLQDTRYAARVLRQNLGRTVHWDDAGSAVVLVDACSKCSHSVGLDK